MVDSRASCFLLKNFFRHIHEHCCYLSLITNCRHINLFLVVQKILASLKLITVFTVTTECIGIKRLWEKVPTTTRHNYYCSFTKPDQFFFSEGTETVSFHLIWPRHHEKFLIKLRRRNADGQNVHHQRVTQTVHPCERYRPTSLSCRLPLSVQKQKFSGVVAASGFVWQKIAL